MQNKKKSVCHMTSAHESNDIRVFVKECSSLAAAGYSVSLVARGDSRQENSVNVVGVGRPKKGRLQRMLFFSKLVYETARALDCDIYHFHDPELLRYGKKLKKQGKIVVFDCHEDVPAQILDKAWIPKPFRRVVSNIYKAYETNVVSKIDVVIAATPHIADTFIGRAKKVIVINNYPKFDDVVFQERPFVEREKIICYAGMINTIRGEKIMIESMRKGAEQLIIACDHEIQTIID